MDRKIGGHVSTAGGLLNAIVNSTNIGANCMQIFAGSPRSWARSKYDVNIAKQFIKSAHENNLSPVFIHALYLINLVSDNEITLNKSLTALENDLTNSLLIDSAGVIVHIGSYKDLSFKDIASNLVKRIDALLSRVPDAVLILENSAGQKGKIGSLEELGFLIKELNNTRVKICLDSAHLFAAGYDLTSAAGLRLLINELNKYRLIPHIACLHLNDSATKCNSRRDIHANLGEGEIGIDGLRSFVNIIEFKNVPIILEVPGNKITKIKGPDTHNIDIAKSLFI